MLRTHQHSTITHEDVMKALPPHSYHLVEYEVVTIRHLVVKIPESFTADIAHDTEVLYTKTGKLPEAPVFLVGVLLSSVTSSAGGSEHSYTGLFLGDATGEIPCEVGEVYNHLE